MARIAGLLRDGQPATPRPPGRPGPGSGRRRSCRCSRWTRRSTRRGCGARRDPGQEPRAGRIFIACTDELLAGLGFGVVTPRVPARRGSHVALRHPDPYPVMAALIEAGIIGDVRPPELLRFGFNALYTSYRDVYTAVQALRQVIVSGRYREPRFAVRNTVT